MTAAGIADGPDARRLRVWPGIAAMVVVWLAVYGTGIVAPATFLQFFGMVIGPSLGVVLLLVWWLGLSRAPWPERWLGAGGLLVAVALSFTVTHRSLGVAVFIYVVPVVALAFVAAAVVGGLWPTRRRRVLVAVAPVLVALAAGLLRSGGVEGDMRPSVAWRWSATPEERLLAAEDAAPDGAGEAVAVGGEAAWPGFRGPDRDGVVRGTTVATDWVAEPPRELWRVAVGPGWSSMAIAGDLLLTQEQRGDEELVTAYRASTGEPVWSYGVAARFWEAMAGAGPRATPTVHGDRVYAQGATGVLSALDLATGAPLWSRDVAADTGADVPDWGFAGSPLVVGDLVVVHSGASGGRGAVAYAAADGEPRWFAAVEGLSYGSPQPAAIDGVEQVLFLTGDGLTSVDPADGATLWVHEWPIGGGARIVQPAVLDDGSVLLGTGFGYGLRRIAVRRDGDDWTTEELWTSTGVNLYFNDAVVHDGVLYGFDGRIMAALDLETGERVWKGGRYGSGQALLLADQDLLLVTSERGEVALVAATPDGFTEVARFQAVEGKTWNHPVLVDGVLYVRNAEEMAAFRVGTPREAASRRDPSES